MWRPDTHVRNKGRPQKLGGIAYATYAATQGLVDKIHSSLALGSSSGLCQGIWCIILGLSANWYTKTVDCKQVPTEPMRR